MAVIKTFISNHRRRPVIHLNATVAGDSSTILLTDLLLADETSSAPLTVNIAQAYCNFNDNSTSGAFIRRGDAVTGVVALYIHGQSEYPQNLSWPPLSMSSSSSIAVYWELPGTVCLELHKVSGYVEPTTNKGV